MQATRHALASRSALTRGAVILASMLVGSLALAGCQSTTTSAHGNPRPTTATAPGGGLGNVPSTSPTATTPATPPAKTLASATPPSAKKSGASEKKAGPKPTHTSSPATSPVTKTTPPATSADASAPKTAPTHAPAKTEHADLQSGDKGARVLALQKQLLSLGYWITGADGTFGPSTLQAVWAVQKAAGLVRDGIVGPATLKAVTDGVRPAATSHSGHVIEIDLAKQLVLIVNGGHVSTILNTSTGSGKKFKDKAGDHFTATTPTGAFRIGRQYDKLYTSSLGLGTMWRPKFFNGGIALHGEGYIVPPYAASHGCARISNPAMNWVWSTNQAPAGTEVLVY